MMLSSLLALSLSLFSFFLFLSRGCLFLRPSSSHTHTHTHTHTYTHTLSSFVATAPRSPHAVCAAALASSSRGCAFGGQRRERRDGWRARALFRLAPLPLLLSRVPLWCSTHAHTHPHTRAHAHAHAHAHPLSFLHAPFISPAQITRSSSVAEPLALRPFIFPGGGVKGGPHPLDGWHPG